MRFGLLLLFSAAGFAASAQAKKAPEKKVVRSGEVIVCKVNHGCTAETVNGQQAFTMDVDGVVVRAALGQEKKVSFADLTITNQSPNQVEVKPEDFRVEVDDVKYKRLSYIDPNGHRHEQLERPEEMEGHGLPSPAYWESVEHKEAKEARLRVETSKVPLLPMGPVAAGASVSGRVYFERPKDTTDQSLILPLRAAILEFPFPKPQKEAKKKKAE